MSIDFNRLPRRNVVIDASASLGALEQQRHVQGVGGINSLPLPERAVDAIKQFRPKLVRIFLQEFFDVYPRHGQFAWGKLDAYIGSVTATGATIIAAIALKPRTLFPKIDQRAWEPASVEEWQRLIAELVQRYSVERHAVSHWEIGNEVDIGENGGCPYLMKNPADYARYYEFTARAISGAGAKVKIGGPALAGFDAEYLRVLMRHCAAQALPLDFISWHLYADEPAKHAELVRQAQTLIAQFAPLKPQTFITEWSKFFDAVSVQDLALSSRQSSNIAAILLAYVNSGADCTCYYHALDQVAYPDEFAPFFSDPRIMTEHWNEIPHRFGLLGAGLELRPQYFVFQQWARMAAERITAPADDTALHAVASRDAKRMTVMVVNFDLHGAHDVIVTLRFPHMPVAGRGTLTAWRIDNEHQWNEDTLEMLPLERRPIAGAGPFRCQFFCPADSVLFVELVSD